MQDAECKMQNEECVDAEITPEDEMTEEEAGEEIAEEPTEAPAPKQNYKAHLSSSVPRAAKVPQGALTKGQMAEIRSIFGDMDDTEIQRLYKRVTKTN